LKKRKNGCDLFWSNYHMKLLFFVTAILLYTSVSAQKLKTGTYVFRYCDLEYNSCVGTCKVVIKGDSITIYATKELAERRTFTKEGDIIDKGIILKHESGKWIVGKSKKDINADDIGGEGPSILNFGKKEYWRF
jgi:hypothetical protein